MASTIVLAACREYAAATKQVVFIEYALIAGFNDAASDAHRLAEKLRDLPCRINLLAYNEVPNLPYRCSPETSIQVFKGILAKAGFRTLVRTSRGADISAACGQLAAVESPEPFRRNRSIRGKIDCGKIDLHPLPQRANYMARLHGRP